MPRVAPYQLDIKKTEAEEANPAGGQISPQDHPPREGGRDAPCEDGKTQKPNHAHITCQDIQGMSKGMQGAWHGIHRQNSPQ